MSRWSGSIRSRSKFATSAHRLAAVAWLVGVVLAGPRLVAAQIVPNEPPYCHATQEGGPSNPDDPPYCLPRVVDNDYAPPPEGWESHVGRMGKVTAFYPSNPVPNEYPVPPNYPHVVLTFQPAGAGAYGHWPQHATGNSMLGVLTGVPNYHTIDLEQVLSCAPTDLTCEYEVRGTTDDIGNPAEWFSVQIDEDVQGNCADLCLYPFGQLYAGVGLVADGNQAPVTKLTPTAVTDFEYTGHIFAEDPDHDPITGYVFDWGDGTVTPQQVSNESSHTYAGTGAYHITGYAIDARGAVGASKVDLSDFITVKVEGPHTVPVGDHIDVTVTITNVGIDAVDVQHNYGYHSGGSPKPGVLSVTPPDHALVLKNHGEQLVGTYRIDGLKDGSAVFAFGADSYAVGCQSCLDNPVYVDFPLTVGNGGGGPTPTPTGAAPATPTPTATPDVKAVGKCRAALVNASTDLLHAEAKAEAKCAAQVVSGKLPGGTLCRAEAKTSAAIVKARAKLQTEVAKACGGKDKACGTADDLSLVALGWSGACPNVAGGSCTASVTDCGSLASCLACIDEAALDDAETMTVGAFVATDPKNKAEKALNKCQATIAGASSAFLVAQSTALAKCWDAVNAGNASGECPAADGKAADAIAKAKATKEAAICKACGGADKSCDGGDGFTPTAIGFAESCLDLTAPGAASCAGAIGTLADLVACIDCVNDFAGSCATRAGAAALTPYPATCHP